MHKTNERAQAVAGLLRQLWFGLATYRLYPDSPERSGFVGAAQAIEEAARSALGTGPVEVEITAEGFSSPGLDLAIDGPISRLARVCFEHRAERLHLTQVPTGSDLNVLFEVLTMPVAELDRAGGLEVLLAKVRSPTLGFGPAHGIPVDAATDPEVGEPPSAPTNLGFGFLVENLRGSLDEQARAVLERMREAIAVLGANDQRSRARYQNVGDLVVGLPAGLRRAVVARLIEDVAHDPIAGRLIGSMSNAELTRALVDLGRDGREPVQIAERLAEIGVRLPEIVDFTAALQAGHEEADTIFAGLDRIGSPTDDVGSAASVSEALAAYLVATEQEDLRSMRWLAAAEQEQASSVALATLQDYLSLERDPHQFERVTDVWVEATRKAVRARDPRRVRELIAAVEGSRLPGDDRPFLDVCAPRALERSVVMALLNGESEVDEQPVISVLALFGDGGVDALFDLLAEEEDRGRRAAMLGILRQLAPGRVGPVATRLADPRWYVVRNAVNVLRHSGDPDVLDLLAGAARHTAEAVRREAVYGLVAGGVAAVPHLAALATAPDEAIRRLSVEALGGLAAPDAAAALSAIVAASGDVGTRRLALDALVDHPAPEALEDLERFAGRSRPRLPRSLRKHARALLRARRGGGR